MVVTAADLAAAASQGAALALSAGERAALVSYLQSLDGQYARRLGPLIDGFERGSTGAWAATTP